MKDPFRLPDYPMPVIDLLSMQHAVCATEEIKYDVVAHSPVNVVAMAKHRLLESVSKAAAASIISRYGNIHATEDYAMRRRVLSVNVLAFGEHDLAELLYAAYRAGQSDALKYAPPGAPT